MISGDPTTWFYSPKGFGVVETHDMNKCQVKQVANRMLETHAIHFCDRSRFTEYAAEDCYL